MKFQNRIYYENEDDEVVEFKNKPFKIDENYAYLPKNKFIKFLSWFAYRILATPCAFIYFKLIRRVKFVNKKILKIYKKGGYFIYANHTNHFCDGFCPALICFPKKPHIIVNPVNISIPFWGKILKTWGALPIPNTILSTKNFNLAIEKTLKDNNPIVIYPEAHLWPYYTRIRNFPLTSFRYPIKYNKPVFTFTTTYKKKKIGKYPKITIYVDGPFFPNLNLNDKEAQQNLHIEVYKKLEERSKLSNYEFIKYIRRSND